jgi:molybdopterin-guanine dinucleotide biosynthesis protein A
MAFMLLLLMFALPAILFIGCVILLLRSQRKGMLLGTIFFCLSIATGFWSIWQSRSPLAGVGLLVLPGLASICAILAWVAGQFFDNSGKRFRVFGCTCLCGSIALLGFNITGGIKEIDKNKKQDQFKAEYEKHAADDRKTIRELIEKNRGTETAVLRTEIDAHSNDSAFLIAALETPYVPEDLLEKLSHLDATNDANVVLMVVRNEKTPPKLLKEIYKEATYPFYDNDLARNKNTPEDLLRALYVNPNEADRVHFWLAQNPSTPRDILRELATSNDGEILRSTLDNPILDCELIQLVKGSLPKTTHRENQGSDSIVKLKESRLCATRTDR